MCCSPSDLLKARKEADPKKGRPSFTNANHLPQSAQQAKAGLLRSSNPSSKQSSLVLLGSGVSQNGVSYSFTMNHECGIME